MADSKITALTAISTVDPTADPLVIVDVSDTSMAASGTTKKSTINQLLGAGGTATLASATITGAATVGTTLGVTGVSTFAAGTALLPALTTTGDTNTGIYYPAADTFAVTTGGTERYRVDSAGNLGIGVTPSAWGSQYRALQIFNNSSLYGASAYGYYGLLFNGYNDNTNIKAIASLYVGEYRYELTTGAHKWFGTTANATAGATAAPVQAMTLDASGRLLVGATSAVASGSTFQNLGTARQVLTLKGNDDTSYTLGLWSATTTGDNFFAYFGTEASTTVRGSVTYNRAGGLVLYNTTSDYRAKDIIGSVLNSGSLIDSLKVYVGKMKGATIERPMLIAHEVQEIAPYAVNGEKDSVDADGKPKYQQMDASALVPLLIAEIQSLRTRVQTLEAR